MSPCDEESPGLCMEVFIATRVTEEGTDRCMLWAEPV